MSHIYVASSWKNDGAVLDEAHRLLQERGFETFDFRTNGRWWEGQPRPESLLGRLSTVEGRAAFEHDFSGLSGADGVLVVWPSGESVALEAAWAAGRGMPVVCVGRPRSLPSSTTGGLELMWGLIEKSGGVLMPGASLQAGAEKLAELFGRAAPATPEKRSIEWKKTCTGERAELENGYALVVEQWMAEAAWFLRLGSRILRSGTAPDLARAKVRAELVAEGA